LNENKRLYNQQLVNKLKEKNDGKLASLEIIEKFSAGKAGNIVLKNIYNVKSVT